MERENTRSRIKLSPEEKKQALEDMKYFFSKERDEQIGILASENLLDFFLDSLGKIIYNKALDDIKKWYSRRMEDVEADFYTLYQ